MSRRSFASPFKEETGLSFMDWRQQACLVAAVPRLVAGEAVTTIAIDLGYDNPAAFTTMFKRVLGASPRTSGIELMSWSESRATISRALAVRLESVDDMLREARIRIHVVNHNAQTMT